MPWVLGGAVAAGTGLAFALNRKSTSQPTPANQAPTDITLSSTILSENKAGAVIGQLQTQDPNQQDRFTYQVNDARFEIVNGTLKLKEGIAIDYEQETNIPLTITSTDNQGLSIAKTITIKVLDVEEVLGNITPPPANTNNAPTDILLSNNTIEENIAGATIGQLTVIDPDADSTFTYKINDDRFEIVNGNLKLKEGIKLDYETAANVIIQVTASDQFGASFEKGFDLSIIGNSVLRTTLSKQNIIKTGNGNDTVIIVGKTSENQFVESDIKNVLGRGVDLSEKLTLNEINNHKKSEIKKSDVINLGKGFDKLVIYGDADLSDVELSNVSQIWVMGMLKIPAKLLDSLPLTSLIGDGTSILYITNLDKEEVRIDFDSLSLSGFNAINIDKETNVIINNRNLTEVKYIGGKGSIQSSVDSEILDLSGKTISVEVKNYDGNTLEPLEHKANIVVDGMLFIGSNLDNQINGTDGNDRLIGKDGNDHIIGGDGDDIIFSGKGNDILEGGSGNDKFIILGDVSGGGKLDNDVDNFILGRSLSSLNGINFSENKNSSKIINGGEGEDTLYVIGESDLSNLSLDNIENIEIRSDITLNTKILYKIKNIQGDGTSILRLTGDSTENSVIYFSKYNVSGIQQLDISENITVVINNIEELDNITTLTGRGHLIIKDTNNYLNELFTVEKSLNVIHENGSLAIGNAKIIDNHIEKDIKEDSIGGYKIFKGTDNSDRISASEVNDRIETKKGDDTLIGKSGDDIYFINGSGHKSIIDIEGNDTLDFSELNAYNGVQVDLNNHIAEAKTEDGNSLTVKMLTGEDVSKNKQPLDLVIMQDLSGSFNDDVITVRQLLDNLTKEIIEKNPNTWFGAASFVDKPREPFGNSEDYVYKTHSKLSHDINSLKQAFLNMIVKSGGDGAEAQLEALYQLALRTIKDDSTLLTNDGEIDFRPNSQRFVVITTDAPYHKSGDFDGVPPNNGDIVLDGTPNGTGEDYPSIEAVKQALIKSNIIPIFAVTHSNIKTYQNLVDSLGRGSVVKLSSDSADLIDAVGIGLNTYKTDFIENIIGTKFDDKIIGNNLDNELNGNNGNDILIGLGGNDHLIGGNGQDTAKYQGNKEDYEISVLSSNKLLIKGTSNNALDDAIDIVDESVEYLEFASGEIVNTIDYFKNVNKKGYKELFSDWKGGYLDFMFNLASAVYIRKNIHKYYNVGGDNDEFTGNSYSQLLEYKDNLLALDLNLGSSISSYREGNERKGSLASFKYIYSNNPSLENDLGGDYISISNKDIVNPVSSSSIAQAYKTSKGDALFISFRGTSTKSDIIDDIWDMSGHYQRYKPFVDSIRNYIDSHPEIEKVFVAGHSLGGEMAKFFMNDFKGDDRFNAVIFEAANKYVVGKDLHYDERIIAIEMEGDPVPDLTLATLGKTIHIYEDEENPNMGIKFHNHKLITIKKPFEKVVNELYSNGFVNNLGEGESKLPSDIFFVPDEGNRNIVNSNNITGSELSNYRILNGLGAVIGTIGTAISAGKFIIELSIIGSHSYISHKLEKIGFIYSGGKYRFTLSERADDLASTFSELFEGVSSALSASNIGLPPLLDLMKLGYNAHPIFEDSSYGKAMVYTPTSLLSNTISPINKDIDIVILKEDGWIRDKILNTSFTINGKFLNNRESDGKLYLVGNNTNNILIANDEGSILISGGDRDILIGGNGNDVMFSGNIVDYPGYNQENPIHRLIEKYMINKEADISFQYGGKGNDILIGNGDNDYFFIDVNKGIGSLEYSNNNNIDNIYNFQVDTVGTVFSEDYLIFSAEQLGFDYNKFINKKIDDSDDKVNFVSENIGEVKFEGFHWFDQYEKGLIDVDAFIKVNRISDYEKLKGNAKANEPTFILDKSNGYLYFDLTGTAHPNDHTLVAKLSDTTESGRGDLNSWFNDMNASQIIIVPNFDMLTSYQII